MCGSVGGWQYQSIVVGMYIATTVFGRETGIIINALIMDFPILKLITCTCTCMSHMYNHIIKLL